MSVFAFFVINYLLKAAVPEKENFICICVLLILLIGDGPSEVCYDLFP